MLPPAPSSDMPASPAAADAAAALLSNPERSCSASTLTRGAPGALVATAAGDASKGRHRGGSSKLKHMLQQRMYGSPASFGVRLAQRTQQAS